MGVWEIEICSLVWCFCIIGIIIYFIIVVVGMVWRGVVESLICILIRIEIGVVIGGEIGSMRKRGIVLKIRNEVVIMRKIEIVVERGNFILNVMGMFIVGWWGVGLGWLEVFFIRMKGDWEVVIGRFMVFVMIVKMDMVL